MAQAPRQTSNSADLAVIKQILESVQNAVKDIPEIQRNIAVMAANFEQVCEDVAEHDHIINGNSKPGLKTDVLNLKNKVENLENSRQPLSKAGWIIFTAVVSSVTAAISGLIVAFVK